MTDEHPTPNNHTETGDPMAAGNPMAADANKELGDQALGAALGEALHRQAEAPASRPPVTVIAERAAARARARNTRRSVVGIAAAGALVFGGVAAWNAASDEPPGEVVVVDDPAGGSDSPATGPITPESVSTGPTLEWSEFDPADTFGAFAFGTGGFHANLVKSVGDGRVLVEAPQDGGNQVFVSGNGVDWSVVPMPPSIFGDTFDIAGERWLVAGSPVGFEGFDDEAFFSDDQGATWNSLALDAEASGGMYRIAAAAVDGQAMALAVESFVIPDVAAVIVARGLVPDRESIQGWTSVEGDTVSFTRDDSSPPESFELTDEEDEFLFGGVRSFARVYVSDGGPPTLAAEFPDSMVVGLTTSEGFRLTLFGLDETTLATSPDGRRWSQAPLTTASGIPVGRFAYSSSFGTSTLWVAGQTGGEYRTERFDGAYAAPLVAELPRGINRVSQAAVGPAGIAVVGVPGSPLSAEFSTRKDGYEVRYNPADGLIELWDLSGDSPVLLPDAEMGMDCVSPASSQGDNTQGGDNTQAGCDILGFMSEESANQATFWAVFVDIAEGKELVRFPWAEMQPLVQPDDEYGETWVGWSSDGADWGWQTASDAFGLNVADSDPVGVDVAVGDGYAIARVFVGPPVGSNSRWFIATLP